MAKMKQSWLEKAREQLLLSMTEPELMADVVNKLKDVTIINSSLSVNQVLRIDHIF